MEQDFGDLTQSSKTTCCSGAKHKESCIWWRGFRDLHGINKFNIDYITMSSSGNAVDFGDLLNPIR